MPSLIYPEESESKEDDPCESPSDPPSVEPTLEPGPTSEKPAKEPTLEPNYDALSEPSAPTREGSIEHLDPKYIARYQKGLDPPIGKSCFGAKKRP